jgi:phosphoenolpyruvate carboxykinase (ATP)
MYHFLSGYTAKLAGTEAGMGSDPSTGVFRLLWRALFAAGSARLCRDARQAAPQHKASCWLVNTGWSGGKFGVGKRMSLKITRALVNAALTAVWRRWNLSPSRPLA